MTASGDAETNTSLGSLFSSLFVWCGDGIQSPSAELDWNEFLPGATDKLDGCFLRKSGERKRKTCGQRRMRTPSLQKRAVQRLGAVVITRERGVRRCSGFTCGDGATGCGRVKHHSSLQFHHSLLSLSLCVCVGGCGCGFSGNQICHESAIKAAIGRARSLQQLG